jgi:hypothetical protein
VPLIFKVAHGQLPEELPCSMAGSIVIEVGGIETGQGLDKITTDEFFRFGTVVA